MTTEECTQALSIARLGRLACARENQPYVVPIYFAARKGWLYSFSMMGQKIEWMRANPLVCLEVDDAKGPDDWRSVVVYGRYHELSERTDIVRALELLQAHVMWWEPGVARVQQSNVQASAKPVFYRISVDRVSGRVATPAGPSNR